MSVEKKAIMGATWLAVFKLSSQIFSWIITILVARILVPDDYGLMEMATIITGFAFIFSDLGLGQAIIQKPRVTDSQLSSVFWFSVLLSFCFALSSFIVAYPTSLIFSEPRVVPLTQAASVLFILSGLQVVPSAILQKKMKFRSIGFIDMTAVIVSSISMLLIANIGGGAWTLIGGYAIRSLIRLILLYIISGWHPLFCLRFGEARSFLRFGLLVAIGRSFSYLYQKSDKFFVGRMWSAQPLGYYSFAMQLAVIPTDKIVSIINQVSYPALASLQFDTNRFNSFYLNISKLTAILVFPIFSGGFLVGGDLVRVFLTEQWYPMIPIFRFLCLSQVFVSMGALNKPVHLAKGKPGRSLCVNVIMAVFMSISFYYAAQYSMIYIIVPWFTTFLIINFIWLLYTLKKIKVSLMLYISTIKVPLISTIGMSLIIVILTNILSKYNINLKDYEILVVDILCGALSYTFFILKLDSNILYNLRTLLKK